MSESKFLQDKVVYLKPIPRSTAIVGNDPKHIAYFKMENASDRYCLKVDPTAGSGGRIINPFESDEEMKYFSEIMGEDLNPYKKNNPFWATYNVTVTKTPELMRIGKKFDLSTPQDMLAYKVLRTWKKEICGNWEDRFNGRFKYCFVDEDYEEQKAADEFDIKFKVGEIYGELKSKPHSMRDFINIYNQQKAKNKVVPEDAELPFMTKELKGIVDSDTPGFLALYQDPNYKDMVFINKAIDKGAIDRKGVGIYTITGLGTEYTYNELVSQIHEWAKTKTEPLYAKILATVNSK